MSAQQRRRSAASEQHQRLLSNAQSHYGAAQNSSIDSTANRKDNEQVSLSFRDRLWRWIGPSGIIVEQEWKRTHVRGTKAWWKEVVSGDAMVLPLLIVTFSCALGDAVTYKNYQVFATNQTGNTVLLAVAALDLKWKSPLLAGVSLAGFLLSALVFGQLGAYLGHRRRSWITISFIFQLVVLIISEVVIAQRYPSVHPGGKYEWIFILLQSIQGGPQVTMATNAGTREIPTAMMTTPYAALLSDPSLFTGGSLTDARARNRRVVYISVFWTGGLIGAVVARHSTLLVMTSAVIALKVLALLLILVTPGEEGTLLEADGGSLWQEHLERGEAGDRVRDEAGVTM